MALTQEQFESLPDFVKSDYAEGEGGFVPVAELKVSKLKSSLDGMDAKLRDFERKEAEKMAEAERAAFERLKKDGKVDEIVADAERRIGETAKQYQERLTKLENQIKTEKRSALVSDLASELATDVGLAAFKRLVASRIDVDAETGKITYLNDDGSASSLDLVGFRAELSKDPVFAPVLKANVATRGGGLANGSQSSGSANAPKATRAQFEAKNPADKMAFIKSGGTVTA